ncbi:MAG: T9SS type A sorting domain-containing protein [Bacteroidetes bacterium]|nr:T9SS type A sorting domain-containing protein [Bacteroidota bacterium]
MFGFCANWKCRKYFIVGFNVTDIGDPCNTLSSFAEQIDINSLEIFPNPGNGNFSISNYGLSDYYQLISSNGELISSGNLKEQHDFSKLSAGIYFLHVQKINTTNTFRIIIL